MRLQTITRALAVLASVSLASVSVSACSTEGKRECIDKDDLEKCVLACKKGDGESCTKKRALQDKLADACAEAFKPSKDGEPKKSRTELEAKYARFLEVCTKACGRGTGEPPTPRQLDACHNMDGVQAALDTLRSRTKEPSR